MNILICLIIGIVVSVDARLLDGQCPHHPVDVVHFFNYEFYMGVWYEILWYDDETPTYDECTKWTYTETKCNAFNMSLNLQDSSNDYAPEPEYDGHGIVSDPLFDTPGKLSTTFDAGPPTRVNNQIVATDYINYAFVYDCENVDATHYNERMWYYDRQRTAGSHLESRPVVVRELIKKYFDRPYTRKTVQGSECTD